MLRFAFRQRTLTAALLLATASCWGTERLIQAGTPEGLPGYALSSDGKLVIEDSNRRRVFSCIEQRLNAKFSWQAFPTKRVVQMVERGQLDLAFPMGFTAERAKVMQQSAPTWDNPDVWLSKRPVNIQDKNLRIAARLGSPQDVEHVADGYSKVVGAITYSELPKTLSMDMVDAVIVPRRVYEDQRALWPETTLVTVGRHRSSGFYLQPADTKALLMPLNRAIEDCRVAVK